MGWRLTVEKEDLQSFERGDGFSQLPHHVAAHAMAREVQQDDVVLGGSLQPVKILAHHAAKYNAKYRK